MSHPECRGVFPALTTKLPANGRGRRLGVTVPEPSSRRARAFTAPAAAGCGADEIEVIVPKALGPRPSL